MARLTDVTPVRRAMKPMGQLDHGRGVETTEIRNRRFCREVEVRGLFPPRKQQGAAWTGLAVGTVCLALELIIHADMGRAASWENCPNPSTGPDTCLPTGKAGFGTTAPSYKMDIPTNGDLLRVDDALIGSSGIQGGFGNWAVLTTPGRTTYQSHGIAIDNGGLNVYNVPNAGDHLFRIDNGPVMTIKGSTGNVGVGTTSPSKQLQVHSLSFSTLYLSSHAPSVFLGDNEVYGSAQRMGVFGLATVAGNWAAESSVGDFVVGGGQVVGGQGGNLLFATNGTPVSPATTRMIIQNAGNVGVGTLTPSTKLHVAGSVQVDGNIAAKYQDVAEWVPSRETLLPGRVVVLDPQRTNHVMASTRPYDTTVVGVVSEQPGVLLGEGGEDKVKVAMTGRVKVKADASHRPIRTGDLLVTGGKAGTAMVSEAIQVNGHPFHQPGTILGKALESLPQGEGEILVLLTLQ